ncbi:hypothetical protein CAPTEDRAFT_200128 [Capitella teleta]|uniref:G-protein coupled receptors family 1 profile domain-containing protein n=1 Tax=Capitella teleta TaxID=283909 RepID=R7VBJ0_CAPTE|nr:hypothetical protein CAPTEDRAFT_200128 [Capitella teleta]|eukprot:ELU13070.1 hypothetical protein CAPTEDRAFT_200128 [Capitella teleta]
MSQPPRNSTWTLLKDVAEEVESNASDTSSFDCTEGLHYRASVILSRPASVLAIVLVIFAVLANALSLLAISQVRMRLTGHLRLVLSLASSDLLIGISVILFLFNKVIYQYFQPGEGPRHCRRRFWCVFVFVKALNSTSLNMTLFNLMAMAADHYLAILRPLHHQSMMSKRRSKLLLISLWTISVVAGFSDYLYAIPKYKRVVSRFTFCEVVYLSPYNEEYLTFGISFVAFVQMLYCYIRICVRIKQREKCMLVRTNGLHVQLKYNTRGLITTLLIVGTFVLCWLPMCLFQVALIIKVKTDYNSVVPLLAKLTTIDQYLYDLHLINAICDPIIYAVRMSEVKLGYRRLFWRLCRLKLRTPANDSYAHSSRFLEHRLSVRLFNRHWQVVESYFQPWFQVFDTSDVHLGYYITILFLVPV